jgi:hypothetical protein
MPDNPLRFTRRNKARVEYAPIADSNSPSPITDSVEMHSIRPTVTVAASSSTRRTIRAGKGKARRKDKYIDDPEEEAGLLKGEAYGADEDEEYEDVEEQLARGGSPTSVCSFLSFGQSRSLLE